MSFEKLKEKKLAINFKQTGAGDSSGPTLKKVSVLTPKIDTGSSSQIIAMRVQVKDNVSGVKEFTIELGRLKSGQKNPESSGIYASFVELEVWEDDLNTFVVMPGSCNAAKTHATDPDPANLAGTACRISGTDKDGVYEVKFILPAHATSGSYRIRSVYAADFANNSRHLNWDQLKKLKLNIGFKNG